MLGPWIETGEVHLLQQILDVARSTCAHPAAGLARADRAATHRAPQEGDVGEDEGERPRRAGELHGPIAEGAVVCYDGVLDVAGGHVSKVLGLLPVHRVGVVHADIPHVRDVAARVLPDEHVVPIKLVLDLVCGHDSVVFPGLRELAASPCDVAVHISQQSPRILVVNVHAKAIVVMVHVAFDGAKWRVLGADAARSDPLAVREDPAGRPDAVLVARDVVADEVVGHAHHVDAGKGSLKEPWHRTRLIPGTNHCIVANDVVHLVSILNVDAYGCRVPKDVLVHQAFVGSVDCDSNLRRIHNCVPLEYAFRALMHAVEM
mmetsp:Transcript_75983/g.222738  ORF Transcript_75983/g.222738 Transcript_75983/m.222738 type:complete len:318 (+) Transcript_75983:909-1862(+)